MRMIGNDNEDKKCSWGKDIIFKPDGEHELDPCIYQDVQIIKNATVIVSQCVKCGHVTVGWKLQENSEVVLDLMSN
jgi:hypothetical protein